MKAVTEFPSFTLTKALAAKQSLTGEGKAPEDVEKSMGETFKMEGEKLKHFMNAIDVAGQNSQNLKRVLVISLNEGENPPAKATQIESHYYVPEFLITTVAQPASTDRKGSARGGKGGKGGGKGKSSPWGMTPEEKAAKGGGAKGPKPTA